MPELPSVCIMIATYNQGDRIGKAVSSALAQDYKNLQVVVSDDASSDNTVEVLKKIDHPRFRYRRNEFNLGRVANYRALLNELTTADWVLCLDGDDHLTDPLYISNAMAEIQKQGDDSIIFYQGKHVIETKDGAKNIKDGLKAQQMIISAKDYFLSYLELRHFSHLGTLYNRGAAIKSGFYQDDIISTDIASILRLCIEFSEKKVILTNKVAGAWVWHDHNISKATNITDQRKNISKIVSLTDLAIENGFDRRSCLSWKRKWQFAGARAYIKSLFD